MSNQLLIIEDNYADYLHYVRLLEDEKHDFSEFVHIDNLDAARTYLETNTPACCIMDFRFPNGTAKQLISELYQKHGKPNIPIVISTGQGDERLAVELMQLGVQDYLVKDALASAELLKAINNAIRTFNLQKELHYMAHHDSLTGLLNRSLFMDRLEHSVKEAKRYNRSLSLIFLDIDHFKQINDTYGHEAGDLILKMIAERIRQCVRITDSVARLGGDEFVVLLPETDPCDCLIVVQKLLKQIPAPVTMDEVVLQIYPSIGMASFPDTARDHNELIKQADAALYTAKERGRSQYVKFTHDYKIQWQRKSDLTRALPHGLQNQDIKLAYQPIYDIDTGECLSVEALVRWQHKGEWIAPKDIVSLIHQGTLVVIYHEWLFNTALAQLKQWQKQVPGLSVAINLPANLCHNQIIMEMLKRALQTHAVSPHHLVLEVTETHLMKNPELTVPVLENLTEQGIQIAIDDFGAGYSSMEYLANLPCSRLKIDQKFLLHWDSNQKNQKIVEGITALGHRLDLKVIAEGIESKRLAEIVRQIGCDGAQGFWFGTPEFGHTDWNTFIESTRHFSRAAAQNTG